MKFGNLWSSKEESVVKAYIDRPTIVVADKLFQAGFVRSLGAIRRKIQRLSKSNTKSTATAYVFGGLPDIDYSNWDEDNEYHEQPDTVVVGGYEPGLLPVSGGDYVADATGDWKAPLGEPGSTKGINYVNGSLPLNNLEPYTRFVMLNDVHVPHNIPLDNVFKFIKDFKPDYVLLVGDIITNDPFSHWDKKSPLRFKSMPQPKKYYQECNKLFYKPLRKTVGDNCKIVHWIGNHEYWSNKAIAEMPEGEGYWEVENNIECIDAWVESKGVANLGKLHFIHGDVLKSGYNSAQKMVSTWHRNVRYGHFHNLEEATQVNPIDVKDVHTARCCGTLEKPNPHYMFNQPNRWVNAFTYGIVNNIDGSFSDHTTVITNNKFMAHGKIYG